MGKQTHRRLIAAAAVVLLALLVVLLWKLRRPSSSGSSAAPSTSTATHEVSEDSTQPAVEPTAGSTEDGVRPMDQPRPKRRRAFIRQRYDLPADTPERMGPRTGYYMFDLETVVDTIRLGTRPGERIERTIGRVLTDDQRENARAEIQAFFDEMTPIVEQVLDEELSQAEAFTVISEGREQLDRELQAKMEMTDDEFYALFPQIEKRRAKTDEIHAGP